MAAATAMLFRRHCVGNFRRTVTWSAQADGVLPSKFKMLASASAASCRCIHAGHIEFPDAEKASGQQQIHEFRKHRMMDLVLVRHGQSEGNVARKRSLLGDHSLYSGEFLQRHSSQWRLTDRGRMQATAAGEWLRKSGDLMSFDRYYVSEYLRAMETSALLKIPGALWYADVFLRERDWGVMDQLSQEERIERYGQELQRREIDRFFWSPPGGESLAEVCGRVDRMIHLLHRECADKSAILVCHGELMWAFRTRIERISHREYCEMEDKRLAKDAIHNGQILHYTRKCPHTGEVAPFFKYMKSVCPWDTSLSLNEWVEIKRAAYSNEDLFRLADEVRRIIPEDTEETTTDFEVRRLQRSATRSSKEDAERASDSMTELMRHAAQEHKERSKAKLGVSTLDDAEADCDRHGTITSTTLKSQPMLKRGYSRQNSLKSSNTNTAKPSLMRMNSFGKGQPIDTLLQAGARVAIVAKTTRLEHERSKLVEELGDSMLDEEALKSAMLQQGMPFHKIWEAHENHSMGLQEMEKTVTSVGVEPVIIKDSDCCPDILHNFEIVFSAGGDGTFLKTANNLPVNVPLIGINTDALRSRGALCCFTIAPPLENENVIGDESVEKTSKENDPLEDDVYTGRFSFVVKQLQRGQFRWKERRRIKVDIVSDGGDQGLEIFELDRFALNEIFFAEADASRPSVHEVIVDSGPAEAQRSSGVVICTGTGSTAWMSNALKLHREDVSRVLEEVGVVVSEREMSEICSRVNSHCVFDSNSPYMGYAIREAVPVRPGETDGRRGGWGRKIRLKSLGFNEKITIDGAYSFPVPYGSTVVCTADPEYSLLSVTLNEPRSMYTSR